MPELTEDQARRMYRLLQRFRDKLAVDICHNGLRDAREFREVCDMLNEVKPVLCPSVMPTGVDRRDKPH